MFTTITYRITANGAVAVLSAFAIFVSPCSLPPSTRLHADSSGVRYGRPEAYPTGLMADDRGAVECARGVLRMTTSSRDGGSLLPTPSPPPHSACTMQS